MRVDGWRGIRKPERVMLSLRTRKVLALGAFGIGSVGSVSHAGEDLVSFCAMGDVPYAPFEDQILPQQIHQLPTDIDFVIHLGDIKPGAAPCERAVYEKVSGMLAKSKPPLFIIPGDNEWNDCSDPAAAWDLWVEHFDRFDQRWAHGFGVARDEQLPQNFAFVRNGVLFVGLQVVGGRVHDPEEWRSRHSLCREWVDRTFKKYGEQANAVVVFVHAKPMLHQADFFGGFSNLCDQLAKPVLLMHGDGHTWIRDRPFEAKNVLRVQVDQGRLGPPVRVTITDDVEEPFRFDRRLAEQPVVRHFAAEGLTRGPEKGTLVIDGGSGGAAGARIFQRFVELAGGEDAKIVVVPTALADAQAKKISAEDFRKKRMLPDAVQPASLRVLHTNDPELADTEEFVAPIREATGVWFGGGRQWRIVDAYGGTRAEEEFRAVLKRGGVIGGSSAGATIQGSFLARGDSSGNTIMLGDHQRGFGYLKNAAIDQHVVARNRQLDLIEILTDPGKRMEEGHDRESLLGLGVDEGTAMVVRGNRFKVIGRPGGSVLVYDPSTWAAGLPDKHKFLRLATGSEYDLNTRTPITFVPVKYVAPVEQNSK